MNLSKLLDEVFAVQKSKLDDSARLMSFDSWDSMTHMVFITRLEEMFEINLTGDEIASMVTIGDIKKVLQSKGKNV